MSKMKTVLFKGNINSTSLKQYGSSVYITESKNNHWFHLDHMNMKINMNMLTCWQSKMFETRLIGKVLNPLRDQLKVCAFFSMPSSRQMYQIYCTWDTSAVVILKSELFKDVQQKIDCKAKSPIFAPVNINFFCYSRLNIEEKIPHTRGKASLNPCG